MSFDEILDLTSGEGISIFIIYAMYDLYDLDRDLSDAWTALAERLFTSVRFS